MDEAFLDRLADPMSRPAAGGQAARLPQLAESVRKNLARLLTSRQGLSEALPDYGLPALADIGNDRADLLRRLVDGVRTAVRAYEPRLSVTRVACPALDAEQAAGPITVRIEGILLGEGGEQLQRVWYEVRPTPDGGLTVVG